MGTTPRVLYRAGKKSGPHFTRFRPGEIVTQMRTGGAWVLANQGGASTVELPKGLQGVWWELPAGTAFDDTVLNLWKDFHGDAVFPPHWVWEPMADMPLDQYVAALDEVNGKFVPA
jgi:hypothetical protein